MDEAPHTLFDRNNIVSVVWKRVNEITAKIRITFFKSFFVMPILSS